MTDVTKQPCRKCGEFNPSSNDYCRRCGAVLTVSTMAVKAQRGPVLPAVKEIRIRYILITAAAMLGLMTLLLGVFAGVAWLVFDLTLKSKIQDLGSISGEILGVLIIVGCLFLLAFGLGGFGMSWLAKQRPLIESMISTTLVLLLFAVVGSAVSKDAPIIAAILLLPSIASAGVGSKLGEVFGEVKPK